MTEIMVQCLQHDHFEVISAREAAILIEYLLRTSDWALPDTSCPLKILEMLKP